MPKTKFRQNTLYNLCGSLLSMAVALVTVPLFLHKIGTERYGVLAIIWLFIGYFGVFDLGLSRATANQIAKLRDRRERADIFWTAILLNASIGVVGGVVLYFIGGLIFQYVFKMPTSMRASVVTMMPWLAASVPIATLTGVLTGVLEGCERFLLVNSLQVFGSILLQAVPLTVAFLHGPELGWLIAAAILTRMATTLPLVVGVLRTLPIGRPRLPSKRWARVLFSYGAWITVSNFIVPFFGSLDKFMIGGISGLSSVTYYAVPERLARQASIFPGALARTLFPRLSAGHELDAKATAIRSLTALIAVLTPLTVFMVLGVRPFLAHWIDPRFSELAGPVGAVVSASVWINGLAFVPYALLEARGRPDLTAKFHLIEILPHVALLWFCLHRFGLIGGAWALVVVSTLDAFLLFWKSDLRIHVLRSFWQGLGWVVLAFVLAPAYKALHVWFYFLVFTVLIGVIGWGLRISVDVAALLHAALRRLHRWTLAVIMKVQRSV
uniref:Putative Polysaccharide biosynthesis family protein n=1 Tax=mine drainage metagenome TaxID=410659 RepID=E6QLI8_9ZZZZ